jgi:transcriptional regulator with GAF, ATPase, and Fis domain
MSRAMAPPGGTADHIEPQVPARAHREAVLLAVFPESAVFDVPFGGPVGRNWLAEYDRQDAEVSGNHIQFEQRGSQLVVTDVGSRNGTWLDGRMLPAGESATVEDGSVLRIGRTLMVYRHSFEGPRQPAAPLGSMVGPFGLRSVAATIESLARRSVTNVLIEGETGTGKELAARAVASALGRAEPYAPVNVAGVASGVFESQLFGHVAGAYSGAQGSSKGVVMAHDGGTIFLDEIGELPLELQPKLLRLLENRELLPVGAERPLHADVLIVAATNRNLDLLASEGQFRRDLYARLIMARVPLPPLRERREDIYAIGRAVAHRMGATIDPASTEVEAMERLLLNPWPNNVRGLMAAVGEIAAMDPHPGLRLWAVEKVMGKPEAAQRGPLTRQVVDAALRASSGNESSAARRLGITRGKLRRFLKKLEDDSAAST